MIYTDLEFRAILDDTFPGVNVDAWERSTTSNSTVDDDVECSKSRWDWSVIKWDSCWDRSGIPCRIDVGFRMGSKWDSLWDRKWDSLWDLKWDSLWDPSWDSLWDRIGIPSGIDPYPLISWGLTWWSGSHTRLASDLSRARQKYVCTVQKYICTVQF